MNNNNGNIAIIIILVILVLLTGYLYLRANGAVGPATAGYYVPSLSASALSAYPAAIYTPGSYTASSNRTYSSTGYMSNPRSTSTSVYSPGYSYTTTFPITGSNRNCYLSGYDPYGNAMTTCEYMQ